MASFRIRGEGLLFNNEMSEDVVVGLLGVGRWGNRWGNADIGHVMCMCVSGRRWAAGGHLGTPLHRGGKLSLFYRTTERQRDWSVEAGYRCLVYLHYTADLEIHFTDTGPEGARLWFRVDSDWSVVGAGGGT